MIASADYRINPKGTLWQLEYWDREDFQWYKIGKPSSLAKCEEARSKLATQRFINSNRSSD